MAELSEAEVQEMLARANRAKPGPWTWNPCDWEQCPECHDRGAEVRCPNCEIIMPADVPEIFTIEIDDYCGPDDPEAEFIAHARTDLPRLATDWLRLREENERLKAELLDEQENAFFAQAYCEKSGKRLGWWDTMALSSLCALGDALVAAGRFERNLDGYGRRWWYRPKPEAAEEAKP